MSDDSPPPQKTPTPRRRRQNDGEMPIGSSSGQKMTTSSTTFKASQRGRAARTQVKEPPSETEQTPEPEKKRPKVRSPLSRTLNAQAGKILSVGPKESDNSKEEAPPHPQKPRKSDPTQRAPKPEASTPGKGSSSKDDNSKEETISPPKPRKVELPTQKVTREASTPGKGANSSSKESDNSKEEAKRRVDGTQKLPRSAVRVESSLSRTGKLGGDVIAKARQKGTVRHGMRASQRIAPRNMGRSGMAKTGSEPQFKSVDSGSAYALGIADVYPASPFPRSQFEFYDEDEDELDKIASVKRRRVQTSVRSCAYPMSEKFTWFAENRPNAGGKTKKGSVDTSLLMRFLPVMPISELRKRQFVVVDAGMEFVANLFADEEKQGITVTELCRCIRLCDPVDDIRKIRARSVPLFGGTRSNFFLKLCTNELFPVIVSSAGLTEDNIGALAERMVDPDDMHPLALIESAQIPLFSGTLTRMKGKKGIQAVAKLLYSKQIVMGETISCDKGEITIVQDELRITNGKNVTILKASSDEECEVWKRQIKSLNDGTSVAFLDLCLFCLSSYAILNPQCEKAEQVIAAVSSPYILFAVDLLKRDIGAEQILSILVCTDRLGFFVRTLVLAEVSETDFADLFKKQTRYTKALVSLFVASSKEWLKRVSFDLFDKSANTWSSLLNILYSFRSSMPANGLCIIRIILLVLLVSYHKQTHPIIPVLSFLKLALIMNDEGHDNETLERSFNDLEQILLENKEPDHVVILKIYPFVQTMLSVTPKLKGDTAKLDEHALNLYNIILKDVKSVNDDLRAAISDRSSGPHPLVLCYRQTLRFFTEM